MSYPTKKLGEIVVLNYGKGISRHDRKPDGKYPVYGANGILDYSDKYLVEGEAIIVGRKGSAGEVTRVSGKFWPSDVTYFVLGNKQIDIDYLFHLFKNLNLQRFAVGVKPGINRNRVYELEIPLPPLSKQRKIVAKLERVLAKISEAKKLRAEARENADNLLPAELHKIFSDGKNNGWEEKELGEVTKVVTGGTPKTHITEYYGGKYLWARPGDLNEDLVVITEKKLSQSGFEDGGVRPIPTGSVMMCCIGSIGKIGIASEEMSTNQQINSFVPDTKKIDGKFLFYSLIYLREKFIAGASSTTLKIINKSRCEKIKIPLPPLAEQKRIVKHLDSLSQKLQKLQEYQKTTQSSFIALEQSVLSKAFTAK